MEVEDPMIFLLNRERVITELFELFGAKISAMVNVPRSAVTCTVAINEGRLYPKIDIAGLPTEKQGPITEELIRRLWHQAIEPRIAERLHGLEDFRYGGQIQ
jgi:hypothetical protein